MVGESSGGGRVDGGIEVGGMVVGGTVVVVGAAVVGGVVVDVVVVVVDSADSSESAPLHPAMSTTTPSKTVVIRLPSRFLPGPIVEFPRANPLTSTFCERIR